MGEGIGKPLSPGSLGEMINRGASAGCGYANLQLTYAKTKNDKDMVNKIEEVLPPESCKEQSATSPWEELS